MVSPPPIIAISATAKLAYDGILRAKIRSDATPIANIVTKAIMRFFLLLW